MSDPASIINLDQKYRARELLDLLRARTFPGKLSCRFVDGGKEYEIVVHIKETVRKSSDV